jgi:hypothetical protein
MLELCTCPDPRDIVPRSPACPVHGQPFVETAGAEKYTLEGLPLGRVIALPPGAKLELLTIGEPRIAGKEPNAPNA